MFRFRKSARLLLILAFATVVYAQFDQGQISGTVLDASQSVVGQATVQIKSPETGQSATATTDQNGAFLFVNLRVGYYDLSVQASGFKTYTRTRIKVDAASRTTVDVGLEVGSISESVSVTADAPVTSLETAQIGRTIDTKQINELALNGRNPFSMAVSRPASSATSSTASTPDG